MAAQRAIYDIMLGSEAMDAGKLGLAIAVIGDLLKGFEKVRHTELVRVAFKYRYPIHILRLALSMYRGNRRIT